MAYYIVNMTETKVNALAVYDSYSEADMDYDRWCDTYPNGWVEIVNAGDYQSMMDAQ